MKKILLLSLIIASLAFVQACGTKNTRGNQSLQGTSVTELEERLKIGVSTKKDVENWLGTPSGIEKHASGDIWSYKFNQSESRIRGTSFIPVVGGFLGGVDTKDEHRTLHVNFNANGTVKSYGFDSSDGSGRM